MEGISVLHFMKIYELCRTVIEPAIEKIKIGPHEKI